MVATLSLSAQQPQLIKDINTKIIGGDSEPMPILTVGNKTYFSAITKGLGRELWVTEGTEGTTRLVRELAPGVAPGISDYLDHATPFGSRMFFQGTDGEHGFEPWITDGSADGTFMLADILPGLGSSASSDGFVLGSRLYFSATNAAYGRELWQTDGTPAGTHIAFDLNRGADASPILLGVVGSSLLFLANDGAREGLWATDGSASGTRFLTNVSASNFSFHGINHGVMLFSVRDGNTRTLMSTDGTPTGTVAIRINIEGSTNRGWAVLSDRTLFLLARGDDGVDVWSSDGTPSGTALVITIPGKAFDVQIHATGNRASMLIAHSGYELWSTDGTAAGTKFIRSVPGPTRTLASGGRLYFTFDDGVHGEELWVTDGSAEGTKLLADVSPGPTSSFVYRMTARGPGLLFAAEALDTGLEPWISDGTSAGTHLLANLVPESAASSYPKAVADLEGKLLFTADDGSGRRLWMTDGSSSGTIAFDEPFSDGEDVDTDGASVSGNVFYFAARPSTRWETWRTDGTPAGTFRLLPTMPHLTAFKGGMFFGSIDDELGAEPRFTDGTVAGTRRIADLFVGKFGSMSGIDAYAAGDFLYFTASTLSFPDALWRTDGTEAGARA